MSDTSAALHVECETQLRNQCDGESTIRAYDTAVATQRLSKNQLGKRYRRCSCKVILCIENNAAILVDVGTCMHEVTRREPLISKVTRIYVRNASTYRQSVGRYPLLVLVRECSDRFCARELCMFTANNFDEAVRSSCDFHSGFVVCG